MPPAWSQGDPRVLLVAEEVRRSRGQCCPLTGVARRRELTTEALSRTSRSTCRLRKMSWETSSDDHGAAPRRRADSSRSGCLGSVCDPLRRVLPIQHALQESLREPKTNGLRAGIKDLAEECPAGGTVRFTTLLRREGSRRIAHP